MGTRFALGRHGKYDKDTKMLTSEGGEQIISVAPKIKKFLGDAEILVATSEQMRAIETGQIIGNKPNKIQTDYLHYEFIQGCVEPNNKNPNFQLNHGQFKQLIDLHQQSEPMLSELHSMVLGEDTQNTLRGFYVDILEPHGINCIVAHMYTVEFFLFVDFLNLSTQEHAEILNRKGLDEGEFILMEEIDEPSNSGWVFHGFVKP
jgi:hypothetical protein